MDEDASDANQIGAFKNLFVLDGRDIFDFVQSTVLKRLSPLCQIDGCKTSVYKLSTTGDYLCVTEDSELDQAAQITDLLSPWLQKAENTFIFTFKSAYSYNTSEVFDKRCFIRTISNNTFDSGLESVAPMEDCNIVHGVSAGGAFTFKMFQDFYLIFQFRFFSFNLA